MTSGSHSFFDEVVNLNSFDCLPNGLAKTMKSGTPEDLKGKRKLINHLIDKKRLIYLKIGIKPFEVNGVM